MTEYIVRSQNSLNNGWSSIYASKHDAEVAVNAIKEANAYLSDTYKFHGWVTRWNGYSLDDGSKVTVSAEMIRGLNF